MPLHLIRSHFSAYFSESFLEQEKEMAESLGLIYGKHPPDDSPWILLSNTHTKLDVLTERQKDQLKLIIHPNSGYDNLVPIDSDLPTIVLGNSIRANAVAHYILSGLFHHFSKLPAFLKWDNSREWKRDLLSQKSVLLIGHGHIGSLISNSLKPLCKKLFIHDPYKEMNLNPLPACDVILVCASLNNRNKHLLGKSFFERLPDNFLLINSARGELIDQKELILCLEKNPHAFAILDVFEKEPFDHRSFEKLSNVITTSHIAGVYTGLLDNMLSFEKEILENFLDQNEAPQSFEQKYQDLILQNRFQNGFII